GGAAIDRDELVEGIAVANHQLAAFAVIFLVLRITANGRVRADVVVASDPARTPDQCVRAHATARPDLHFGADHGQRTDGHVVGKLGARIDDRSLVDVGVGRTHRVDSAHISSQVAASLPSTTARAVKMPMLRIRRFRVTSSRSWSPGTTGLRKRALSTLAR